MGVLKSDGKAINCTVANGTGVTFGELYRIDGWNGIALTTVDSDNTKSPDRGFAMEVSERIWYIEVPSGLAAARGTTLWWSSGAGMKVGKTNLVAQGTGSATGPTVKVEEAKDSNNIVGVRVLNIDYTI